MKKLVPTLDDEIELLRVRDDRRRLLRTLREAKAGALAAPCAGSSGSATPPKRQA